MSEYGKTPRVFFFSFFFLFLITISGDYVGPVCFPYGKIPHL